MFYFYLMRQDKIRYFNKCISLFLKYIFTVIMEENSSHGTYTMNVHPMYVYKGASVDTLNKSVIYN